MPTPPKLQELIEYCFIWKSLKADFWDVGFPFINPTYEKSFFAIKGGLFS
jgi:hypothetical protein